MVRQACQTARAVTAAQTHAGQCIGFRGRMYDLASGGPVSGKDPSSEWQGVSRGHSSEEVSVMEMEYRAERSNRCKYTITPSVENGRKESLCEDAPEVKQGNRRQG